MLTAPYKDFDLSQIDFDMYHDVKNRVEGSEYPEGFATHFQALKSYSDQYLRMSTETVVAKKPYKQLYVKKISYEWEGGTGVLDEDFTIKFTTNNEDAGINTNEIIHDTRYYNVCLWHKHDNGWYYSWPEIIPPTYFVLLFHKKKIGDVFPFKIILEYKWDDEPMTTQVLDFIVTGRKGKFLSWYY
jgi:hypothetical protein